MSDALGSVRLLLDSSRNASDGYAYRAFGRQVSEGGLTPNPYHFVGAFGYYEDWEMGLQLLTARYYDAEVGRFVTRDPIGFDGGDWNVYGYALNSPTLRTDPDGHGGFGAWWAALPWEGKLTVAGASGFVMACASALGHLGWEYIKPILTKWLHHYADRVPKVGTQPFIQYVADPDPLSKVPNSDGSTTVTWNYLAIPANTPEADVVNDLNQYTPVTRTYPAGVDPTPPVIMAQQ